MHLLFLVFLALLDIVDCVHIDLNGIWTVANATMGGIPGKVPGGVHTALMGAGILGDPYYRKNDAAYMWVGRGSWRYTRSFQVSEDILQMNQVVLVCEGLDTVATVMVNDQLVGQSDNMFVRYIFNVKDVLKINNTITVDFTSPVEYARNKSKAIWDEIPPKCPPYYFHGECHRNMIRKMQCSFSWDWGPVFVTMGIWRDIYITATSAIIVTDLTTETTKTDDELWNLKVKVFMLASGRDRGHVDISLAIVNTDVSYTTRTKISANTTTTSMEYTIPKSADIKAWWPMGYGAQSLYTLTVTIKNELGLVLAENQTRIGFRTVELVQEPVATQGRGLSFYFRVNGHPIFLKGSNWVPADSLPERVTRERLRSYMQSAVDANMNCLRVWGGGVYESDYFYDLADEYGILIWQDFMFACALYPVDEAFLSSVKEEITYQVRRLKNHPCILAYSGNNENEAAIIGSWWPGVYRNEHFIADYIKLYVNVIQKIVDKEDTLKPFILSSPSNGIRTIQDGGISNGNPGDTIYGDIHDYQYSAAFYEDRTYKIPRMASEYGLQSFPSLESLQAVYDEEDLVYDSELNTYRQHHSGGNGQMEHLITMYMIPPNSSNPKKRFEDMIYCTQIVQAVAMGTETEHYRRWQSDVTSYGEGMTMGALYWMFADIWQAPSWASIEYGGKWKMLHYYARHFFAPLLISPYVSDNKLHVHIVLDKLPKFEGAEFMDIHKSPANKLPFGLTSMSSWRSVFLDLLKKNRAGDSANISLFSGTVYMRVFSWDSMVTKYTEQIPFELNNPTERIYETSVRTLAEKSGCPTADRCFVVIYFGDMQSEPTTWLPLTTFKDANGIKVPNLKVEKVEETDAPNTFAISLITDAVAPFVWLEAVGMKGRFSDNGFLMFLVRKTVQFYAWEETDASRLKNVITVKSLTDIYQ